MDLCVTPHKMDREPKTETVEVQDENSLTLAFAASICICLPWEGLKSKQMGSHQTKKPLRRRTHQQNEEAPYRTEDAFQPSVR